MPCSECRVSDAFMRNYSCGCYGNVPEWGLIVRHRFFFFTLLLLAYAKQTQTETATVKTL